MSDPDIQSPTRVAQSSSGGPRIVRLKPIADPLLDNDLTASTSNRSNQDVYTYSPIGRSMPSHSVQEVRSSPRESPAIRSVSDAPNLIARPRSSYTSDNNPITHSVLDASGQRLSFTRAVQRFEPAPAVRSKHTQLLAKNSMPLPVNEEEQATYDKMLIEQRAKTDVDEDIDEVTPDALRRLEQFARHFKLRRIKLGFTQYDVSSSMAHYFSQEFSQTTISRFEAMNLSFNNMIKLKPMLDNWLIDTERRIIEGSYEPPSNDPFDQGGQGIQSLAEHHNILVSQRKRRKRTPIDGKIRQTFEDAYHMNSRPNPEAIDKVAARCGIHREVVRIWFCNRRQRDRRRAQMLLMRRQHGEMDPGEVEELEQLHREAYAGDMNDGEAREDALAEEADDDDLEENEGSAKHARHDPPSLSVQVERKKLAPVETSPDPFDRVDEYSDDEHTTTDMNVPSTSGSQHVRTMINARTREMTMENGGEYGDVSRMAYRPPRAPEVVVGPDGLQRLRLVASGQAFTVASPAPIYTPRGGQYAHTADITIEEESVYDEQGGVLYEQIVDEVTGRVIYTPITALETTALEPDPLADEGASIDSPATVESIDRQRTPPRPTEAVLEEREDVEEDGEVEHEHVEADVDQKHALTVEDFFAPEENNTDEQQ